MGRLYGKTAFQRHLSFFDRHGRGTIRPYQSLRSALALGLSLPVAVMCATGIQILYGNAGLWNLGAVHPESVPPSQQRTMLEDVPLETGKSSFSRRDIVALAQGRGRMDRVHVLGLWALAADPNGLVTRSDVELFRRGELLPELERRRSAGRRDVIPFMRGGPGS